MATIFEGFIIAITILSTNIADGNKIWGFIMVTQHIPTMTKSHHGGEMSVMIKVGKCQWQNPTIHEKYYWEYVCFKVSHITMDGFRMYNFQIDALEGKYALCSITPLLSAPCRPSWWSNNTHWHHVDSRNNNLFIQNKNKHILEPTKKGFGISPNYP